MTEFDRPLSPVATYRIQLRQGVDFDRVVALSDYLVSLGVSHVYLSPCLRSAPGSSHGYDVTDPTLVDQELGGEAGRLRMVEALRSKGLGILLDIVPNHMSVASEENRWWWDVLENGPFSVHAATFDVDWGGPTERARNKVLLPVLADHYGRVLEDGKLSLIRDGGEFFLRVLERRLPTSAESLAPLLLAAAEACGSAELELTARDLELVASEQDPTRRARYRDVVRRRLAEQLRTEPNLAAAIDRRLELLNADVEALDATVAKQFYRLAHYRIGRYDLDYRRFFDINDLAAISSHRPEVFERTHALVLKWADAGEVDGLRVDHPDGLRDPTAYFQALRQGRDKLWVVAEKILEGDERLPDEWPVSGTTGYDFMNVAGGLFVDSAAEQSLTALYREFLNEPALEYAAEVRAAKRTVLDDMLASDLWRLTQLLQQVCAAKRRHRDFANEELRRALREVIAGLEVYRTYVKPGVQVRDIDRKAVQHAIEQARQFVEDVDSELLGLVEELATGGAQSALEWSFVARFQQLSAATMAKGLEDTVFYRFTRLLALNEVGGDPSKFGANVQEFHALCGHLQARWPLTLLGTTTHDTKRSEDARLRIAAISELPQEWSAAVQEWSRTARALAPGEWPDRRMEYAFWQTLVAAYPIPDERLQAYLQKAMREAKVYTTWTNPNAAYEDAVQNFARIVLANSELMASVERFVSRVKPIAYRSSLSQTLLKLSACGVPDIYQSAETWDTRLTDPDNRNPVDFEGLQAALAIAERASLADVERGYEQGLPKLWLTQRVLWLRRQRPELFGAEAAYRPLISTGREASNIVCFSRGERVVVIAPRLFAGLMERGFGDTRVALPPGSFHNLFDPDTRVEGSAELSNVLARFPVALLVRE